MKTFIQWAEENKLDVPVLSDAPESEKTVEEKTKRNIGGQYPDAYARAQYPHKYFNPIKSTADLDLKNAGSK